MPVRIKLFTDGFKALHAGNFHGVNQLPIDGKKTVLHQALFLLSMFHRLLKGIHHGKQVRRELVDAELFGLQHIGFRALAGVFDFRHRADIHVVIFSDLLLGLLKLFSKLSHCRVILFLRRSGFLPTPAGGLCIRLGSIRHHVFRVLCLSLLFVACCFRHLFLQIRIERATKLIWGRRKQIYIRVNPL